MTSQSTSIYTPFSDGHTVRDIVEHTPALVNEAWCRTLLRHTLDSLEQQHASGAPHRPITPDTLVMLDSGETLLLPAGLDAPEAEPAADLHALALVVHYAITAEYPPEGPLGPRLYDDYSDQLTRGLDSCLGPNRRLRPNTIAEMRALLGIEAGSSQVAAPAAPVVEPVVSEIAAFAQAPAIEPAPGMETVTTAPLDPIVLTPAPAPEAAPPRATPEAPAPMPEPAAEPEPEPKPEPLSLRERTEAGMLRKAANPAPGAGTPPPSVAQPAPATPKLHDSGPPPAPPHKPSAGIPPGTPDRRQAGIDARAVQTERRRSGGAQRWGMLAGAALVVLAAGGAIYSWMQQHEVPAPVPAPAQAAPPAERAAAGLDRGETVVAAPAATATAEPTPAADNPSPDPVQAPPAAGAPAAPSQAAAATADEAIVNGTTYKLLIKPWGTVYVDGVDRGVSPPVKRLTLAPGQHTIRLVNPNFPDHVITVEAGTRESATIQYDFRAPAR